MQEWRVGLPVPAHEYNSRPLSGQSDPEDKIQPVRTRTYPEKESSFTLDNISQDDFETFRTWFDETLNGGCAPFTADWLETAGFDHHVARFSGEGYDARRNGVLWRVTLNLEIIATTYSDGTYY